MRCIEGRPARGELVEARRGRALVAVGLHTIGALGVHHDEHDVRRRGGRRGPRPHLRALQEASAEAGQERLGGRKGRPIGAQQRGAQRHDIAGLERKPLARADVLPRALLLARE